MHGWLRPETVTAPAERPGAVVYRRPDVPPAHCNRLQIEFPAAHGRDPLPSCPWGDRREQSFSFGTRSCQFPSDDTRVLLAYRVDQVA